MSDDLCRDWDKWKKEISELSREQLENLVFWALHKQRVILYKIADMPDRLERPDIRDIEADANDIWLHYINCVNGEM